MKIYQILLMFILCCKMIAQENITVEYNQIFNTEFPKIGTGLLQIYDDKSIFIKMQNTYRDYTGSNKKSYFDSLEAINPDLANGEKITITFDGNFDYYFYLNDKQNNKFSYTDELSKKLYLIEDNFKLDWNISDETKIISGYKAYKAETFFRGRKWIAWFCPDLPYAYGPWKLHGLPGLILEAYDETFRYNYVAIKIFNNKESIAFSCEKCPEINIVSYVKKKFEIKENSLFIPDRDTKVVRYEVKHNAQELKYEWEY